MREGIQEFLSNQRQQANTLIIDESICSQKELKEYLGQKNQSTRCIHASKNKPIPKVIESMTALKWSQLETINLGIVETRPAIESGTKDAKSYLNSTLLCSNRLGCVCSGQKVDNHINSAGITHLCKGQWKHLNNLFLSSNRLSDESLRSLMRTDWHQIKFLNLWDNWVSNHECTLIVLADLKELTEIELHWNGLIGKEAEQLRDYMMHKNSQLQIYA